MSKLLSGVRNSCDMFARNSDLYLEVSASCSAFSSSAWRACSTSRVLAFDFRVLLGEQLGFFLQFEVGVLQFFLAALQFFGQRLRLLEQIFRSRIRFDGVQHDADGFHELIEERLVSRAELFEGGQFHDRLDLAFEQHRQNDDVRRRRLAEAGSDLHVIGRRVGDQDALLLQRGLSDQTFAEREFVADVLAIAEGVAGQQFEVRLVVLGLRSASSFGVSMT